MIIRENTSIFDPRKIPGSICHSQKKSSQIGNMIACLDDRSLILSDSTRSFLPTRKVVKLVPIPKSAAGIITNTAAVSRVSQQGLRDYSYPEADHAYGFIGNINSIRLTDKQAM